MLVLYKDGMLCFCFCFCYNKFFDQVEWVVEDDFELLCRVRCFCLLLQYVEFEIVCMMFECDFVCLNVMFDIFVVCIVCYGVKILNECNNVLGDYCWFYWECYLWKLEGNFVVGVKVIWEVLFFFGYLEGVVEVLIDEFYGGMIFGDSWIGWEGRDGSFIVDLGEV